MWIVIYIMLPQGDILFSVFSGISTLSFVAEMYFAPKEWKKSQELENNDRSLE